MVSKTRFKWTYLKLRYFFIIILRKLFGVLAESISIDTLKNSMKSYQYLGIVESHQVNDVQIYYLSTDYDDVNKLDTWAEKIKCL